MDPYAHHIPKKVTKYSHMDSGGLPPHPSPAMQPVKETLIPMTNGYSNNDLHHHHRNITRPSNQVRTSIYRSHIHTPAHTCV